MKVGSTGGGGGGGLVRDKLYPAHRNSELELITLLSAVRNNFRSFTVF
jgi:hypothetical protein